MDGCDIYNVKKSIMRCEMKLWQAGRVVLLVIRAGIVGNCQSFVVQVNLVVQCIFFLGGVVLNYLGLSQDRKLKIRSWEGQRRVEFRYILFNKRMVKFLLVFGILQIVFLFFQLLVFFFRCFWYIFKVSYCIFYVL